jgi:hypothetical protein
MDSARRGATPMSCDRGGQKRGGLSRLLPSKRPIFNFAATVSKLPRSGLVQGRLLRVKSRRYHAWNCADRLPAGPGAVLSGNSIPPDLRRDPMPNEVRRPLTAATRVRIPHGTPSEINDLRPVSPALSSSSAWFTKNLTKNAPQFIAVRGLAHVPSRPSPNPWPKCATVRCCR